MSRFVPITTSPEEKKLKATTSYRYGWKDKTSKYKYKSPKGLNEKIVREISTQKNEPDWMLQFRLEGLKNFLKAPMPKWGADLSKLNFEEIYYYLRPTNQSSRTWKDVPDDIKNTFEKLGIPEAERKYLSGVKSQYDSEVVYGSLKKQLQRKGVIFLGMDDALKQHPELVKKYFASVVPVGDNKFAALNTAVWSGGSFIYVPRGVEVDLPLQAYFRINSAHAGQFERTLIILEEDSKMHYIEGCSAPSYTEGSLHSAVVEIIIKPRARCQYTTIQNWYTNVYNLVTKRAKVEANAKMFWVDGNLGSYKTMKYPACVLVGDRAHGETLSVAFAGKGQQLDAGAKMIHLAPNTTSQIISKSISKDGGQASYRGMVSVAPGAKNSKSKVVCDALILDDQSRSDTYPVNKILTQDVSLEHEATVSKVGEEQLFYLMSRGLSEEQASAMIVSGFIEPIVKNLPMEYAVELNRLVELEMEGSVG
jgi:Fe-S cluster assembly protein SufB